MRHISIKSLSCMAEIRELFSTVMVGKFQELLRTLPEVVIFFLVNMQEKT